MKKFIELGIIKAPMIYSFLNGLLNTLSTKIRKETKMINYPIAGLIVSYTGMVFVLIGYFVVLFIKNKKAKNSKNENIETKKLFENLNPIKRKPYKMFGLLFLGVVFNLLFHLAENASSKLLKSQLKHIEDIFISLLIISLLSLWIFRKKIFRHNLVSILAIFLISVILDINEIYTENKGSNDNFLSVLKNYFASDLILGLIRTTYIIYLKYIMKNQLLHPYLICGSIGFGGLILSIIIYIFTTNFPCEEKTIFNCNAEDINNSYLDNFTILKNSLTVRDIGLTLLDFLFTIIYHIFYYLIVNLEPCLILISLIIEKMIVELQSSIHRKSETYFIIIGFFLKSIILFFLLLYNEIIILNLCDLDKNTTKKISDIVFNQRISMMEPTKSRASIESESQVNLNDLMLIA